VVLFGLYASKDAGLGRSRPLVTALGSGSFVRYSKLNSRLPIRGPRIKKFLFFVPEILLYIAFFTHSRNKPWEDQKIM
jgi:hypothetical protein